MVATCGFLCVDDKLKCLSCSHSFKDTMPKVGVYTNADLLRMVESGHQTEVLSACRCLAKCGQLIDSQEVHQKFERALDKGLKMNPLPLGDSKATDDYRCTMRAKMAVLKVARRNESTWKKTQRDFYRALGL